MSEMIERVTAAIEAAMRQEYWKPKAGQEIVDYAVVARAAIEAMREPTIEMRKRCTFEQVEVDWPALIDAALSEKP